MVFYPQNIPVELQQYPNWVAWKRDDDELKKVPFKLDGTFANPVDSRTWCTFDELMSLAKPYPQGGDGAYTIPSHDGNDFGIGFVFSDNDPFVGIDLDVAEGTVASIEQTEIYDSFNSYTEFSPSQRGVHIICKANLPTGVSANVRWGTVEMYSTKRFFTFTGMVHNADYFTAARNPTVRNTLIEDYTDAFYNLYVKLGGKSQAVHLDSPARSYGLTDDEVMQAAWCASNGALFKALWEATATQRIGKKGDDKVEFHTAIKSYPSQSEADQALVNLLYFYSKDIEQTYRLFLQSGLGQRPKAYTSYHHTYMPDTLRRARDLDVPEVQLIGDVNFITDEAQLNDTVSGVPEVIPPINDIYTPPEGLLGDIAKFIYASAPRPVAEIALAGAITLMAGICGRSYSVSGTGLNQYVLLMAGTGTGKEAAKSGSARLLDALSKYVPGQLASLNTEIVNDNVLKFEGPGHFASEPALRKALVSQKCFYSIFGEFGIKLKRLLNPRDTHGTEIRGLLLDAYNKSGPRDTLSASARSNKSDSVEGVRAPNMTLLGETTPHSLFSSIDEGAILDGFVPRFTIIEYAGQRPAPNVNEEHYLVEPDIDLLRQLQQLCDTATRDFVPESMKFAADAQQLSYAIRTDFDNRHNKASRDSEKELWNRAHVRTLKLAALVAVGKNQNKPIITTADLLWAKRIIINGAEILWSHCASGDLVEADKVNDTNKHVAAVAVKLVEYIDRGYDALGDKLHEYTTREQYALKIFGGRFLRWRVHSLPIFKKARDKNAVDDAVKILVEMGAVGSVETKHPTAKMYRVTSPQLLRDLTNLP